jgi:hypothetical protein
MRLLYAANETNSNNTDGCCTALYFSEPSRPVTEAEVVEALQHVLANRSLYPALPLPTLVDEYLSFETNETPVSRAAGQLRVEASGSC